MDLTILMPVYDDWPAAAMVCAALDRALSGRAGTTARVLLIDDGSGRALSRDTFSGPLKSLRSIDVLRLRRNLGHQRAIAVGLVYVHRHRPQDVVLVMDADGEDRPEDVLTLLDAFEREGGRSPVFAERRRRVAGVTFKAGYLLFRILHRLLTGRGVRIGNFSVVPPSSVANLVVHSSLWSHYAATAVNARLPICTVRLDRGARLSGASRMNIVALVAHGLGAVSVYRETVATRVLLAASVVVGVGAMLLIALVTAAVRGSAPASQVLSVAGLLAAGVLQILLLALAITMATLASREQFNMLPVRDCELFVLEYQVLLSRP